MVFKQKICHEKVNDEPRQTYGVSCSLFGGS